METKNYSEEIDIQKYLLVLKRRWLIISGVFTAFATLGIVNFFIQSPAYEASGKLLFELNRTSSLTGVGEKLGDLESIGSNPLDTQALLVQSVPVLQEVIDTLKLKDKDGNPLDTESIAIKVETIIGTDGLKVSHVSEDPQVAKEVVNQVMKSAVANNVLNNRSKVIAAGKFLEKQVPQSKRELDQAAEVLRQFRSQNRIVDLEEEATGTVKSMLAIDDELNNTRLQIANLNTQEQQIRRQLQLSTDQALDITSLSQVSGVQELLVELQKIQTQLTIRQASFTDEDPKIIDLKSQEAGLRDLLQKRITESSGSQTRIDPGKLQIGEIKQNLASEYIKLQSERLGLESKLQSISNIKNSYNQRAYALPNLRKIQGELERRLSLAQKNYENLWTKYQEIKLVESQTIGNSRILQYAEVDRDQSAMKKKILILVGGVFGGLLLGVATAFFIDVLDKRVKTSKEAEELFDHTLLGLIPAFKIKKPSPSEALTLKRISRRIIVETSPRSVIHESYQMLQANLKFVSLDKKVRTIVVTSSVPGEGKSEVSANLAAVIAQTGRRVLLVDADMRRPSQHHLWGLINAVGLSNVIVGQDELFDAVQQITPNLSVLTTGDIPTNSLSLIDSEPMLTLIDTLFQKYDYVIFDTPPLVGTADAAVLGKMVDGVLVVVRPDVVDSTSVNVAKALLSRSEANILGIVANSVNIKQESSNYFYYNSSHPEQKIEKVITVPLS
jgi:polysaccharide biosynthesis transport protein